MQTDKNVGKMTSVCPLIMARIVDVFIDDLCQKCYEYEDSKEDNKSTEKVLITEDSVWQVVHQERNFAQFKDVLDKLMTEQARQKMEQEKYAPKRHIAPKNQKKRIKKKINKEIDQKLGIDKVIDVEDESVREDSSKGNTVGKSDNSSSLDVQSDDVKIAVP